MDTSWANNLRSAFEDEFGSLQSRKLLAVRAPGRSEIAGNHTDHEGGDVIAAAVNRYVQGLFSANDSQVMCVLSEGYGLTEVDLSDLAPRPDEKGTTKALVRGMAAQFADRGFAPQGFDAALRSDVLGGSGLSSSAAFELELAQAMNALWADGAIAPEDLAVMSQKAEREWFGKPCGLMDQASVALGSIQHMSFFDPDRLSSERLEFSFADHGYALCLVAVGADHSALIDDYAAVPGEMQEVARMYGKERLADVPERDVLSDISAIRSKLGDRPVLRTLHYYGEMRLVNARAAALRGGDIDEFLRLTNSSSASSAMYLQNVSVAGSTEQPAMVALALADELLEGTGATRIHGGGFGGTIQAFVPADKVDAFAAGMDSVFGEGACGVYDVDFEGAQAQWL